jgi:ribosomal protein L11 methyltransferase
MTDRKRQMTYTRITVRVSREAAPGIIDVLLAATHGIEERARGSETWLIAYLPGEGDRARVIERVNERLKALHDAGLRVGRGSVATRHICSKPWEQLWKAGFDVVRIGRQIVIKPTWKQYVAAPGEVVVELDPGMAFGTGQHATTRGCLAALGDTVKRGDLVFDIGTGSGILAIAAAKLGAAQVLAVEVDESAARIARQNAIINQVSGAVTVVRGSGFQSLRGRADVVVANLTAAQILELAPEVAAHLRCGGAFIGSGIAAAQAADVTEACVAAGLTLQASADLEGWVTMTWREP